MRSDRVGELLERVRRPAEDHVEELHRAGDPHRRALGHLQRQHLGHLLAEHDVHDRDQGERDRDRDDVRGRRREAADEPLERRLDQVGEGRLAEPAEPERRHRDPELAGRDVGVEVPDQVLRRPRRRRAPRPRAARAASGAPPRSRTRSRRRSRSPPPGRRPVQSIRPSRRPPARRPRPGGAAAAAHEPAERQHRQRQQAGQDHVEAVDLAEEAVEVGVVDDHVAGRPGQHARADVDQPGQPVERPGDDPAADRDQRHGERQAEEQQPELAVGGAADGQDVVEAHHDVCHDNSTDRLPRAGRGLDAAVHRARAGAAA